MSPISLPANLLGCSKPKVGAFEAKKDLNMSRSSWALLCLSCFLPCAQGEVSLPASAQNAAVPSSPGPTPQIFAPGVISGPGNDGSPTFSPDGNTLFFTRSTSHWTIILESHQVQGKWSTPRVAP